MTSPEDELSMSERIAAHAKEQAEIDARLNQYRIEREHSEAEKWASRPFFEPHGIEISSAPFLKPEIRDVLAGFVMSVNRSGRAHDLVTPLRRKSILSAIGNLSGMQYDEKSRLHWRFTIHDGWEWTSSYSDSEGWRDTIGESFDVFGDSTIRSLDNSGEYTKFWEGRLDVVWPLKVRDSIVKKAIVKKIVDLGIEWVE